MTCSINFLITDFEPNLHEQFVQKILQREKNIPLKVDIDDLIDKARYKEINKK